MSRYLWDTVYGMEDVQEQGGATAGCMTSGLHATVEAMRTASGVAMSTAAASVLFEQLGVESMSAFARLAPRLRFWAPCVCAVARAETNGSKGRRLGAPRIGG